jgi:ADP-dependent NAD(P)H-hydrate dehydratase / NAD(P)H-hydrate epimerase
MSVRAHRVAAVRAAEEVLLGQLPAGSLMQRAAAGLAAVCLRELRGRRGRVVGGRVVLLVGAGNNGGDALWAGARLAGRGVAVEAVLLGSGAHLEGLVALRCAGGRVLDLAAGRQGLPVARGLLAEADLVVDGIVGLAGSPGLREPAAGLVAGLVPARDGGATVVAVDLPSGVDADGGTTPQPHVRADVTVTFGALKPCLLLPPACRAAGRVEWVDLGLGPHLPSSAAVDRLLDADVARLWPVPGPDDDKYSRGVVGVVAGSAGYTGAAVLAVGGALRSGAGMVRYVGPPHPGERVRARWPEAVIGAGRVQAWVLGSGVDPDRDDDGQVRAILDALGEGLPSVLDAGALELVTRPAARGLLGPHVLLTPHAGELARLLSVTGDSGRGPAAGGPVSRAQVAAAPLAHAVRAAARTGATVLLKGSTTVIATPDGRHRTQAEATGWLATAGAGDVLAGVAGTLLASGLDPLDAAGMAALVHGRAAASAAHPFGSGHRRGPGGPILAQDVIAALPRTLARLLGRGRGG